MLGFSSFAEFVATNLEHESQSSYPRNLFKQRLERDGEIRGLEVVWPRRDGTLLAVCEHACAVRDAEGRMLYYEGTVEDITARKRADEERRELLRRLHAAAPPRRAWAGAAPPMSFARGSRFC